MAVTSDTSSISYTGNNSTTTSYAVPFVFQENSHLVATAKVTATGVESAVTLTNHTGAGDPSGGTVRTAVAVPATSTLTIYRTVPATQTTTYQEGGDFPAASHERALDKLTMLGQQNARRSDRSIRVTEADGSRNDMVAVANALISLNSAKQPTALTYAEVRELLAITGTTLNVDAGTITFANAAARALAVPSFIGQIATQRDTARLYIATGTSAGNWDLITSEVLLSTLSAGFFTADATGRGKFASGFVDTALVADSTSTTTGITNSKLRHSSAMSVVGRSGNTGGAPADISAANDGEVMRRSGTSIGFGQIATAGIADGAVTAIKAASGMAVQIVSQEYGTYATVTGAIPADDTIPQNNEGTQLLTLTITPSSSASRIVLFGHVYGSTDANAQAVSVALFRGSQANAIFTANDGVAANTFETLPFAYVDAPATTDAITYALRFGTPNTFYINGSSSARRFGGTAKTVMVAMEIR